MTTQTKKHKISVQVGENEDELLRIILPRESTVRDLAQAVQERLHKRLKTGGTGHETAPRVTEIRERRKVPGVAHGRSHAWGPAASALQLDEDDALSDLIESDTEGPMFVAMIDGRGREQSVPSPRGAKKNEAGGVADKKVASGKGKNKAEVPFKISYTVAGMPRDGVSGGDGGVSALDRRGPREGSLTASTSWSLLDFKRAIAKAEGIRFTPDRVAPLRNEAITAAIDIKVTISPNVTVPISVRQAQTVGDVFRKVARAARAARAAKEEEQKAAIVQGTVDVDHRVVVAAATDAANRPDDGGGEEDDRDGGLDGGEGSSSEVEAFLASGHVLMRQDAGASHGACLDVETRDVDSLSAVGPRISFLDAADQSIRCQGCPFEEKEEYVLVGPGAISPNDIPSWMVRVRVLGQLVGSIQIPNRRLASARVSSSEVGKSESGDAGSVAPGKETQGGFGTMKERRVAKQLHTLGDLRAYLAKFLELPSKRMEIWIAPSESDGVLNREQPRGERALVDNMSLGHYGLYHLGVVDVRLQDSPRGEDDAGATDGVKGASKGEGDEAETEKREKGEDDILRLRVKTARMRARGDLGAELVVSKQTFSLALVKDLACRALGVPLSSVSRVEVQNSTQHCRHWGSPRLSDYNIRNGSILVLHLFTRPFYLVPRLALKDREEEDTAPTLRMTVALWAEWPSDDDGSPSDVSTPGSGSGRIDGTLSTTLYPLRSTPETDAVSLKEWGLLRDSVHVYAVFYLTTSPTSAAATKAGSFTPGRQDKFGTAPCWRPRPLPASLLRQRVQTEAIGESRGIGSRDDSVGMEEEGGEEIEAEIGDDSEAGMACFLSSLYAMDARMSNVAADERFDEELGKRDTIGWLLRELMALLYPRFPPAALALTFTDDTEAECACVAQCLWGLAREVVPSSVPDGAVFEHLRPVLAWLMSRSANAREDARKDASRKKTTAAVATAATKGSSKVSTEAGDADNGGEPRVSSTEEGVIASQSDSGADGIKANVKVDIATLTCCRVLERLELNHAVRLRVDGALLEGIYSRGGGLEKEQELLEGGAKGTGCGEDGKEDSGNAAQPVTVELVPWKAIDRLLLASPFTEDLTLLRLKQPHPDNKNTGGEEENPTSWLSLVDWRTVVGAIGSQPWARVIAPLGLPKSPTDSLTRDRNGHMAVFTGQTKGAERSVLLFSPLEGGKTKNEDAHVLAQALARLAKRKGGLPGDDFDSAEATTRMALEGIVVCMDSSCSMGGRPGFADDHDPDTDVEHSDSDKKRELKFDWSEPFPKVTEESMSGDSKDALEEEEAEDMDGYDMEMRRAMLKGSLRTHSCLPQLREVATLFSRGGSGVEPMPSTENVLEELILEEFDPSDPTSWETAEANMKIYRLYRQEFLDILLKDEEDTGDTSTDVDFSDWARRQFICPITQGIMIDPVVTADGHSYERHAILQWFSECRANKRWYSSPLSGAVLTSDTVTSNHALKSSIQDWLLAGSREGETSGVGRDTEGEVKQMQTSVHEAFGVKINLRYGSKSEEITVDRAGGDEGIKALQVMAAQWKALEIFGSDNNGGVVPPSRRRVSPQTMKLVHKGLKLTSLWMLKEGDVVLALDVGIDAFASFTVKIKCVRKEVYLLARKDETIFSIKLRLWAQQVDMRPSWTVLWHNLQPAGDDMRCGWRLTNNNCVPPPPKRPISPEAPSGNPGNGGGDDQGSGDDGNGGGAAVTAAGVGVDADSDDDGGDYNVDEGEDDEDEDCDNEREGDEDENEDGEDENEGDNDDEDDVGDYDGAEGGDEGVCILDAFWRSPFRGKRERPSLTRLDAVKQLFHAFINRTQAYDIPVEVGLVNFGSDVNVACEPSPLLEEFRSKVDGLTPSGDTRLWDALHMACTLLEQWRAEWLKARKRRAAERSGKNAISDLTSAPPSEQQPVLRIVVLSDGEDTKSSAKAHTVCLRLQKAGIVVDSITVGTEKNERLKCVSLATGGYAFHPETLRDALRLNELETVLSSRHREPRKASGTTGTTTAVLGISLNTARRPNIVPPGEWVRSEGQLLSTGRLGRKYDTEETATFKKDPRINNICRPLGTALASLGPADADSTVGMRGDGHRGGGSGGGRSAGGMATASAVLTSGGVDRERLRRVRREMMDIMKNPHEAFEVFPSNEDMCFWKVLLVGPESTPYRGGCWLLSVYFPPRYPSVAPTVRFVTPIRHCNINAHGRVCHALLDRSWTPNTTVSAVLGCVYGLLLYPDHDDPLDSTLALQMYDSSGDYETAIMNHVKTHASKPKTMWVAELEAAGMSSQDRLTQSRAALAHAKEALSSGRPDEAKRKAWTASIYAAGGPAPIEDPPRPLGPFAVLHEPGLKGLRAARAEACMLFAWAELKEPTPNLDKVTRIAANARLHNESSPDVSLCLAKVAETKWKQCEEGSVEAVAHLKEAMKQQTLHLRMTDRNSAARKKAMDTLGTLKNELQRIDPSQESTESSSNTRRILRVRR